MTSPQNRLKEKKIDQIHHLFKHQRDKEGPWIRDAFDSLSLDRYPHDLKDLHHPLESNLIALGFRTQISGGERHLTLHRYNETIGTIHRATRTEPFRFEPATHLSQDNRHVASAVNAYLTHLRTYHETG